MKSCCWHKIHQGRAKVQSSRRFVVISSGTLDQSWSPRSAARHDPSSAALPTMPVLASSHQPFNCSCPLMPHTWTVWCFVCCMFVAIVHAAGNVMMHVFAHFEAAPRVSAVVVFMWMFSFPSLSLRDTLQQRPDPAWGRTPPICLYLGASHLQADNFRRMEILIYL